MQLELPKAFLGRNLLGKPWAFHRTIASVQVFDHGVAEQRTPEDEGSEDPLHRRSGARLLSDRVQPLLLGSALQRMTNGPKSQELLLARKGRGFRSAAGP